MEDYLKFNKESWNNRVETHVKSDFYFVEDFIQGKTSLKPVELALLGDVQDKEILHLQCHFGQDSISLSRLGAKVTGVDLSDKAIETAKDLAQKTNSNTEFICSDVYSLAEVLDKKFDFVFTSYGTIGWLPDLDKWAKTVAHFLKPQGKLIFVEFHPVVWMFDDDFEKVGYDYFNTTDIIEISEGTYADKNDKTKHKTISWNHPLSEVFGSLLKNTMEINTFEEYNYSPYNCFKHTEEFEPHKFRIKHLGNKIPMLYSIVATKK